MKLIDKLKNVFFEEVEEDEEEEEIPQTFAKKVELPKKKIETREFEEVSFKKEEPKEEKHEEEEKNSFQVKEEPEKEKEKEFPMMFDDDDFMEDGGSSFSLPKEDEEETYRRETREYNEDKGLYQGKKELSYVESISNKPTYSYTKNYYEEKETKGFKPSPIISPIYGILDKNYHKEEVVTKRETRIASTYNKPDLDSIRNKAFGSEIEETTKVKKESNIQPANEEKVYDVNSNKPQVHRVTLADADEYYNDLGLAYNVDYSDASRTNSSRVSKYNPKEKKKSKTEDDNLFDLIDSMYNKED